MVSLLVGSAASCSGAGAGLVGSEAAPALVDASARTDTQPTAQTLDGMLQARLQQAVRELPNTREMRGPNGLLVWPLALVGAVWSTDPLPQVRMGGATIQGNLPAEMVLRVVRQGFGTFRLCYEELGTRKELTELQVTTTFSIATSGMVAAAETSADLGDPQFAACMNRGFKLLEFPAPRDGAVKVTFPIVFSPPAPNQVRSEGEPPPNAAPKHTSVVPVDPAGPWPIVSIEGGAVKVDGVEVAKTEAIGRDGRAQKVDALADVLSKRREAWLVARYEGALDAMPELAFPGVAGLRLSGDVAGHVAKSVFQTMAYAGWPDIFVQSSASPERILPIGAAVPAEGGLMGPSRIRPLVEPTLHVTLIPANATLKWRDGAKVIAEQNVPREGLAKAVCDSWATHGAHRAPEDARRGKVVLHASNAEPYDAVLAAAAAVLSCKRTGKASKEGPAFWVQFTID